MRRRPHLQRRVDAAQKTLDRFKGHAFEFGRYDCAQMVFYHLRALRRPIKAAARAGSYDTLLGGAKELKKAGHSDLFSLMDSCMARIPPAAAVVGDIIAMPGHEGPGALAVALGNGRALAYHEEAEGAVVVQPLQMVAAWRAVPRRGDTFAAP